MDTKQQGKELRKKILQMSHDAGACHIGSSLSCVEICLAMDKMEGVKLFSKASGAATVYALTGKNWKHLKENPLLWPGGSLGMGLSVSAGVALGNRNQKVYCLISDGELNEGSTWEAIMFSAHQRLNNLFVILDYNKLQACGNTEDICGLEPLKKKLEAFNCEVREVKDGHNQQEIEKALTYPPLYKYRPIFIIVNTVKGKGVSFAENNYEWHYKNLTPELLEQALKENA